MWRDQLKQKNGVFDVDSMMDKAKNVKVESNFSLA